MPYTIDINQHFKIWFSVNPNIYMNAKNIDRLLKFRASDAGAKITLVYSSDLLTESANKDLIELTDSRNISLFDIPVLDPAKVDTFKQSLSSALDQELYDLAVGQLTTLDNGGNPAIASDYLRLVFAPHLGIYSDLDTVVDLTGTPIEQRLVTVKSSPILFPGKLEETNNDVIICPIPDSKEPENDALSKIKQQMLDNARDLPALLCSLQKEYKELLNLADQIRYAALKRGTDNIEVMQKVADSNLSLFCRAINYPPIKQQIASAGRALTLHMLSNIFKEHHQSPDFVYYTHTFESDTGLGIGLIPSPHNRTRKKEAFIKKKFAAHPFVHRLKEFTLEQLMKTLVIYVSGTHIFGSVLPKEASQRTMGSSEIESNPILSQVFKHSLTILQDDNACTDVSWLPERLAEQQATSKENHAAALEKLGLFTTTPSTSVAPVTEKDAEVQQNQTAANAL